MIIVIITEWFSEKTGYAENCLPKALAKLGHQVHVVTTTVKPYFNSPFYDQTYKKFFGDPIVDPCTFNQHGFTVHRLPLHLSRYGIGIQGLLKLLTSLRPDVVQTFDMHSFSTFTALLGKFRLKYKLFLEAHIHASVFNQGVSTKLGVLKAFLRKNLLGSTLSHFTSFCYPISTDSAEIATNVFGIRTNKIKIVSLGVDTDVFHPISTASDLERRKSMRDKLLIEHDSVLCVYSGRFSEDKNPLCLAQAIGHLQAAGHPFQGLFIGNGPQQSAINAIPGCRVIDFVPYEELAAYYHACDIGVWPTQESTSQLDAAACGLPLVLSDKISVTERVEDSGLLYREGDPGHLAGQLMLLQDKSQRAKFGATGAAKVESKYSWSHIAKDRLGDYLNA